MLASVDHCQLAGALNALLAIITQVHHPAQALGMQKEGHRLITSWMHGHVQHGSRSDSCGGMHAHLRNACVGCMEVLAWLPDVRPTLTYRMQASTNCVLG